jgi:hypothetical protein
MNPMRMLIMLAVFWAAGSLLLAAESPPASKPAPAAKAAGQSASTQPAKTGDAKTGDAKADTKEAGKDAPKEDKRSIAEQAEAALKAAAEADGTAAEEPPKSEAQDDTQAPPSASTGKPSPQRFVPSEQVRADFDVSFPIDI